MSASCAQSAGDVLQVELFRDARSRTKASQARAALQAALSQPALDGRRLTDCSASGNSRRPTSLRPPGLGTCRMPDGRGLSTDLVRGSGLPRAPGSVARTHRSCRIDLRTCRWQRRGGGAGGRVDHGRILQGTIEKGWPPKCGFTPRLRYALFCIAPEYFA